MASHHSSLDAAATERKARLAKLASLKRKQPSQDDEGIPANDVDSVRARDTTSTIDAQYLSGRNYDPETRGPRLGFETAPSEGKDTVESRVQSLVNVSHEEQRQEQVEEKPLDLFSLQPKKPNWDLKRDLAEKTDILDQRTDNAIARLVRARIEGQNQPALPTSNSDTARNTQISDGGLTGADLVEGIRMREKEEAKEERKAVQEEMEGDDD